MEIECCLKIYISIADDVGIEVGAAIGLGLIIWRTHIKFAAEESVERHLILAGVECFAHAQPSPFGSEFGEHA